jgi:RNA polymerase sigma-70 factor (ECF subfamily)
MNSAASLESTSTSLVARAQRQDAQAWQRLCDLYAPVVYQWARQAGLQASDAADIGQEVFRVVAARLGSFQRANPGDSFRGWLYGITRNKLREHFRRRTVGGEGEGGSEALARLQLLSTALSSDSSAAGPANARTALMHRALETIRSEFEATTWQAFWRATIDDHKTADIAADLTMSTAAVRQAKYRVLRRLRQELDGML